LPVWTPDAAYLAQLGPAKSVQGYRVRLPKDYQVEETAQGLIAQGPRRSDGSAPKFVLISGRLSWEEEKLSLEQGLDKFLASVKGDANGQMKSFSQSDTEEGRIGNLTFLRTRFTNVAGPSRTRGIAYYAHDENRYIYMMGMDTEPHDKETLPLLDATALTFQSS
jgi:hypothetical protein